MFYVVIRMGGLKLRAEIGVSRLRRRRRKFSISQMSRVKLA